LSVLALVHSQSDTQDRHALVCRASIARRDPFDRFAGGRRLSPDRPKPNCPSAGTPPSGPVTSWTGPFIGAQVLGSLSNINTTETTAATGARFHQFDTFAGGGGGGLDFGYNWLPWRNNWLVGVIADVNFLSDSGGHVFSTMDNLMASGQMRVGYLTMPGLLCYGQTGVSLARESLRVDFGGPITEQSRVAPGYAIGAGCGMGASCRVAGAFGGCAVVVRRLSAYLVEQRHARHAGRRSIAQFPLAAREQHDHGRLAHPFLNRSL
jgi:hypothetical protein